MKWPEIERKVEHQTQSDTTGDVVILEGWFRWKSTGYMLVTSCEYDLEDDWKGYGYTCHSRTCTKSKNEVCPDHMAHVELNSLIHTQWSPSTTRETKKNRQTISTNRNIEARIGGWMIDDGNYQIFLMGSLSGCLSNFIRRWRRQNKDHFTKLSIYPIHVEVQLCMTDFRLFWCHGDVLIYNPPLTSILTYVEENLDVNLEQLSRKANGQASRPLVMAYLHWDKY